MILKKIKNDGNHASCKTAKNTVKNNKVKYAFTKKSKANFFVYNL